MTFLDTNIFLRFLVQSDVAKAEACRRLFRALESGDEEATTSESVIAEVVYVLGSKRHYGLDPAMLRSRLAPLLQLNGLKLPHRESFVLALEFYVQHTPLDFEDALTAAHMRREGIETVKSYDRDFDRIPGLRRVEPALSESDR
jgi:predicted nucleic acid-binding protein